MSAACDKKIRAYLKRIGFEGTAKANFITLHRLQRRHLMTVPYENLDIMRGVPLSLEIEKLYEKIVVRGRGGYCFELNGLFAWLLKGLGFGVKEYFSRYLRDEPTVPMRRHRVLHVSCADGDFLTDVGVGAVVPREPLPLVLGKISEQNGEQYKLEKDNFLGYVLCEWHKGEWRQVYAFTTDPQLDIDFVATSYYCEAHPESCFRTMDMVHLFTENGRKSVAAREFKHFTPTGARVITPASEEEYEALLEREFGISLY
jgi:N-hydroxyarylamine O-acetyltransferase